MKALHIGIGFADKPVADDKIRAVITKAGWWAKYAPNCWIVYTADPPQTWANRLREICSKDDSIYVAELNIGNEGGWLQKEIWDWLDKVRANQRQ